MIARRERIGRNARFIRLMAVAGALLATVTLIGCTGAYKPADDTDLRLQAASHAFGGRFEYLVVHSAGKLADGVVKGIGGILGPSQTARDLATRLIDAQKGTLRILVTGADPARTMTVIRDAFSFHAKNRLPGLEFLFLGEPAQEADVRSLVEGVGGTMRFAPFEG